MVKKTITYTDYNGNERTEDFYFNLTKTEVVDMELSIDGGLSNQIQTIVDGGDMASIVKIFKDIVLKSYGIKSEDGKRFIKTQSTLEEFTQTEAYSIIFMGLATDTQAATDFVNGIVPNMMTVK